MQGSFSLSEFGAPVNANPPLGLEFGGSVCKVVAFPQAFTFPGEDCPTRSR